jgi:hypothetical protein
MRRIHMPIDMNVRVMAGRAAWWMREANPDHEAIP